MAQVAYWPLNENTGATSVDASGHGHVLALSPGHGTWTTGKFGASGLACSGTDHSATVTPALSLGVQYTVALWINGWNGTDDGVVMGGPVTTGGYYVFYLDSTTLYHRAATGAGNFVSVAHGGGLTGGWHHLAVTRAGLSVQFYKDGVAVGSPQSLGVNDPMQVSSFGAYRNGTFPIALTLDDIRCDDVALTAGEVAALYALNPDGPSPTAVVGTAAGLATVTGAAHALVASAGTSTGTGSALGTGQAWGGRAGASAGTSTAVGASTVTASAAGVSTGTSTALGVSGETATVSSVGTAVGTALVDGRTAVRVTVSVVGNGTGTSTGVAYSQPLSGSAVWIGAGLVPSMTVTAAGLEARSTVTDAGLLVTVGGS